MLTDKKTNKQTKNLAIVLKTILLSLMRTVIISCLVST